MLKPQRKEQPLLKLVSGVMVDLPSPSSISLWWNFGSLLGVCLIIQIVTGLFLSFHYCVSSDLSFDSVVFIVQNINYGWVLRNIHVNCGTLFFLCLYAHIGRGMYFGSYMNFYTWSVGVILLVMVMATAFLGYILPWGQMSFWGATVITSMFSAVPYVGTILVQWLWGGFAVGEATLVRFYSFHFVLPFIIAAVTMVHIMYLHQSGSNNPLGLSSTADKVVFHPYFSVKDVMGVLFVILFLVYISFYWPVFLSEADNFIDANPMVTPTHIQPEWYFLFVYAILRSVPNKLGGVVALCASILILFFMPLFHISKKMSNSFYPLCQGFFWCFVVNFFLLTWIGAREVASPFVGLGQMFTFFYFCFFFVMPFLQYFSDEK
uniref:Cytochrome b n=1 Tax=Psilodens balduri TaxID=1494734 RepID=A0A2U8LL38_9MOLL|nr:cytochrome b [Psilodens balduri]